MGLDLTTIAKHNLNGDLYLLKNVVLEKLSFLYEDSVLQQFFKENTADFIYEDWSIDAWYYDLMGLESLKEVIEIDNCLCFKGPWAISLMLGLESYHLHFNVRWEYFLINEYFSTRLIKLISKFNEVFGGQRNIYIPDNATRSSGYSDLVTESYSFESILERMKSDIGPPCESIVELRKKFEYDEDAYMIF